MTLRRAFKSTLLALCTLLAAASGAAAQRDTYDDRYGASPKSYGDSDRGRNMPGEFDYYALVLSWSPTHCAEPEGQDDEMQCARRDGRRYSFVLHGLWPQYERGYPESCRTRRRPFVPQPVIDGMLDIMPSTGLIIHEYKKHGTCSGFDPQGYFEMSRRLFRKIRIPESYINPYESQFVSPEDLEEEFLDANPGLEEDMISVSCGGAGNRLREVRICFTKEGSLRACGPNEAQRKLCSAQRMFVPPVRSQKTGPETDEDIRKAQDSAKPKPQMPQQRMLPMPKF